MRTCVRASYRESEASDGGRGVLQLRRDAAPAGPLPHRRQRGAAARSGLRAGEIDTLALRRARRTARASCERARPLAEILVERSSYARSNLKARLYAEGLKQPVCELCGQDELWRGKPIGLILDHVNGVRDDNGLENLRIVCPNCAATLDTHCGRKNRLEPAERTCLLCGAPFRAEDRAPALLLAGVRHALATARSRACPTPSGASSSGRRTTSSCARSRRRATSRSGARYGVSDNAIRKWVRQYERERRPRRRVRAAATDAGVTRVSRSERTCRRARARRRRSSGRRRRACWRTSRRWRRSGG